MQSWEYDCYAVIWGHGVGTAGIRAELNRRGGEGWELVGMVRDESPDNNTEEESVLFVFKRPRETGG